MVIRCSRPSACRIPGSGQPGATLRSAPGYGEDGLSARPEYEVSEIVEGDFPVAGIDGIESGWTNKSYTLPPSAAGQDVKVVFEFSTNMDGSFFNGFYIDDVVVTQK